MPTEIQAIAGDLQPQVVRFWSSEEPRFLDLAVYPDQRHAEDDADRRQVSCTTAGICVPTSL